jgi:hypothetical protein
MMQRDRVGSLWKEWAKRNKGQLAETTTKTDCAYTNVNALANEEADLLAEITVATASAAAATAAAL